MTAARHRAFIAPRLLGSIVALASFPAYLIARGAPSALELIVFAWLVVPILTAYFLSRTGRYESAHVLSSLALTGLVTAVAALDRRHHVFRRHLACGRAARGVALGVAPCRCHRFDLCACGCRSVGACQRTQHAADGPCGRAHRARHRRHRVGRALRGGDCARRRGAGAHQFLAALRRRGSLPALGAQHDRRDHPARPRWRGAVRVACGRSRCSAAGLRICTARVCSAAFMSPTGRLI